MKTKNKRGIAAWIWILIVAILLIISVGVYIWLSGDGPSSLNFGNSIPQPPALPS